MTQRHAFRRVLHLSFRVLPDSDHCSLGIRVPPHSEASGDPEARVSARASPIFSSTPGFGPLLARDTDSSPFGGIR